MAFLTFGGGLLAQDQVDAPEFSVQRGFYDVMFAVNLSCATPGATIRYTTNGCWPSETVGTAGTNVTITATTPLRAIAFKAGAKASKVVTHTYVFVNDVVNQPDNAKGIPESTPTDVYSPFVGWGDTCMDPVFVASELQPVKDGLLGIPTLAITADMDEIFQYGNGTRGTLLQQLGKGIMPNAARSEEPEWDPLTNQWERACAIELIYPDGRAGFQVNCGVRIAGNSTLKAVKKQFALLFKDKYGPPRLDFPLMPHSRVTTFDELRLYSPLSKETYNPFLGRWRETVMDSMAREAQHGLFVNLYINGAYWGIYDLTEVADEKMGETHFGGDKDDWDAQGPMTGGSIAPSSLTFLEGLDNLADPARYEQAKQYLNVEHFIGFRLTVDTLSCDSSYHTRYIRSRATGMGYYCYMWDTENSSYAPPLDYTINPYPPPYSKLFTKLTANADFRVRFADHVRKHCFNGGALTAPALDAAFVSTLDDGHKPFYPEFARWNGRLRWIPGGGGTLTNMADYARSRDDHRNIFIPNRPAKMLEYLRGAGLYPLDAPEFSQYGGSIAPPFNLTISKPAGSTDELYYTIDGKDPRVEVTGAVYSGAVLVANPSVVVALNGTTLVKARMKSGGTWSGITEATFTAPQDLRKLRITEIMYHPPTSAADEKHGLLGLYFDGAYSISFNAFATSRCERADAAIDFSWGTNAPVSGVKASLYGVSWDGYIVPLHSEVYTFFVAVDGYARFYLEGASLMYKWSDNPLAEFSATTSVALVAGQKYRVRLDYGKNGGNGVIRLKWASASQTKEVIPNGQLLAVKTCGDDFEFVELKNTGATPLDLSGISFTAGINFVFPPNTLLGAGEFAVLARNPKRFAERHPGVAVAGVFAGLLDNDGEQLALSDAGGAEFCSVTFNDAYPWPISSDGAGSSIVSTTPNPGGDPSSPELWRASANANGSPGADDPDPPATSEIRINEVLAHADPLPAIDWIELHNPSSNTASIAGWFLTDNKQDPKKFRIPDGMTIPANGYVVFDEEDFNPHPGTGTSFSLSSLGEEVYLFAADAAGNLIGYSQGFKFGGAENGVTFGRFEISTGAAHYPAMAEPTPGASNRLPKVGPVVITTIMYNPPTDGDEFVEIRNITSSAVKLYDPDYPTNTWKLTGTGFVFPPGSALDSNQTALVVGIAPAAFRAKYGIPVSVPIFGPYPGSLDNGGEALALKKPDSPMLVDGTAVVPYITVDEVTYDDMAPWAVSADGGGKWLERVSSSAYADDPANWRAGFSGKTIVASVAGHGTISPSGVVDVVLGGNATFAMTPSEWYYAASVLVDGNDIGTSRGFTFTNVTDHHTILAVFEADVAASNTPLWWLAQWYPTNNLHAAATNDSDGDGMFTWAEYVCGTHPTNARSVLAFTNLTRSAGNWTEVRWSSESNRFYTLGLSSNLLLDPFSTVLTNRMPANPPVNVYTDLVERFGASFYRVMVTNQ